MYCNNKQTTNKQLNLLKMADTATVTTAPPLSTQLPLSPPATTNSMPPVQLAPVIVIKHDLDYAKMRNLFLVLLAVFFGAKLLIMILEIMFTK